MDRLTEVESFIYLLRDETRIKQGGDSLEKWAEELLALFLQHRDIKGSGGVLVPQVGESSGVSKAFISHKLDNGASINNDRVEAILTEFEKRMHTGTASFDLSTQDHQAVNSLIISPISFGFNRPIGYFWALVDKANEKFTESLLTYCSTLASLCIRANKACHAFELFAKPVWVQMETSQAVAQYCANLCREALQCKAVIIWLSMPEHYLKTIATSGERLADYEFDLSTGVGIAGKCAESGVFLNIDNLQDQMAHIAHPQIVQDLGLRSAMFIPMDLGGETAGVFGVYASRPNAFSEIDENIAKTIAQILTSGYVHTKRLDDLSEIQSKILLEAPAIETGLLATERVHDVLNEIGFAQNSINEIINKLRNSRDNKEKDILKQAKLASGFTQNANKIVKALARRAKLNEYYPKKIKVGALLSQIVDGFKNEFEESKIKCKLDVPDDIMIFADYDQIERVFVNIISNAMYFLGTVPRERRLGIAVSATGGVATIKIFDNGPGIAPYQKSKIFDIFYTTRGGKGMGFGLHIVDRIVKNHRGSIRVETVWGEYTVFYIHLPLAEV